MKSSFCEFFEVIGKSDEIPFDGHFIELSVFYGMPVVFFRDCCMNNAMKV